MEPSSPLASQFAYCRRLVGAGWQGMTVGGLRRQAGLPWTPAAVGAALGVLGARTFAGRRSRSGVALGGVIGTVVGCGAAAAWVARASVLRSMTAVRDARWLETNPIDYA